MCYQSISNVACKFDATAGKQVKQPPHSLTHNPCPDTKFIPSHNTTLCGYTQVLVLTSHGDKFTGSGPVGINKDGTPRSASQEWTDWKYPPTAHSCAPYCNVQRVGGGIETRMPFTEGTVCYPLCFVRPPCPQHASQHLLVLAACLALSLRSA